MKQCTARSQGRCRARGGRDEENIHDRKSIVPNGLEGMRVMRMIILRSKRLHPWRAVEVHAVVAAMGGGRNMLPKRGG